LLKHFNIFYFNVKTQFINDNSARLHGKENHGPVSPWDED
jgi:hypothetical protein